MAIKITSGLKKIFFNCLHARWMTPLVKYLLKRRWSANASGDVTRAKELSKKVSELIAQNRTNWGRSH